MRTNEKVAVTHREAPGCVATPNSTVGLFKVHLMRQGREYATFEARGDQLEDCLRHAAVDAEHAAWVEVIG